MTAVEWLKIKMAISPKEEMVENINVWFAKAKAMEKEQIKSSFNQGYTQCSIEDLKHTSRDRFVDAEDYYNKTFKSE